MARGRPALRNWAEYGGLRLALATLNAAPLPLARRLASCYAALLDHMVPRLRRVARENLSAVLPELSESDREARIDGVFESVGRTLLAFARFPRIDQGTVHGWIRCEGLEHVRGALERGRGLIFATGHLGNWELSAYAFALLEQPIQIVVRPLDNPLVDGLVNRYRNSSGNHSIDKRNATRGILQALGRNQMVGILADQHVQDGLAIQFFGRPARAPAGIAKIAAKTGAAVVPGFALWSEGEQKYVLRFFPAVEISGDAQADTQRVQDAIERVIREYPEQWLWIHRRWKM